ncbi:hypothetical protein PGT21_035598 [Puccinia graminis f. sp. tritici]|uniref:Uncharacterized protein n=1 Tax=Puccinia graminis f. sp. tritici TaxID=56615 RepID=A0A5B0MQU1_PUCGR|nr:hypothetical protein PGT21_035598 [Puccinia graminis f. sp. tritici]
MREFVPAAVAKRLIALDRSKKTSSQLLTHTNGTSDCDVDVRSSHATRPNSAIVSDSHPPAGKMMRNIVQQPQASPGESLINSPPLQLISAHILMLKPPRGSITACFLLSATLLGRLISLSLNVFICLYQFCSPTSSSASHSYEHPHLLSEQAFLCLKSSQASPPYLVRDPIDNSVTRASTSVNLKNRPFFLPSVYVPSPPPDF